MRKLKSYSVFDEVSTRFASLCDDINHIKPVDDVKSGVSVRSLKVVRTSLKDMNKGVKTTDFCLNNLLAAGVDMQSCLLSRNAFEFVDNL